MAVLRPSSAIPSTAGVMRGPFPTRADFAARSQGSRAYGPAWGQVARFDFDAMSAHNFKSTATLASGGYTLTATNTGKCQHFKIVEGSGLQITQAQTGVLTGGTGPLLRIPVSDLIYASGAANPTDYDELLVQIKWSGSASGNFARLCVPLTRTVSGTTNAICPGVMYQTSPGRWEAGSVSGSSQYTDPGTAVDASEGVIEVVHSLSGARMFAYASGGAIGSGGYTDPNRTGHSLVDAIGTPASSAKTYIAPSFEASSAYIGVGTFRTSGTTSVIIHKMRIAWRKAA